MFHILHKLCVTVPKKVLLTEKGPRLRYPWSHNHCRTVGASDPSHPTLVQHAFFLARPLFKRTSKYRNQQTKPITEYA